MRSPLNKRPIAVLRTALLLLVLGTTAAGCGADSNKSGGGGGTAATGAAKPLKVAMVLDNEPNDEGWGTTWINAAKQVQKAFGSKVDMTWRFSIPDPNTAQAIESLIRQGNKVIITTTFGEQQAALELAAKYPDVTFLSCEAVKTLPNLSTVDHMQTDGLYIAGMAAAAAAKGNRLGLVETFPIPLYIAMANAWQLGAQKIKPDVKTRVVWSNDWVDPSKGQRAARALVGGGAEALTSLMAGPGTLAPIAKSENVPWVAIDTDLRQYAPEQYLTSVLLDWGPWMKSEIKAILDKTWKPSSKLITLQNGGIKLAPWGDGLSGISAGDRQKIEDALSGLKDGSANAFAGPVKDQSGKERVGAGSNLAVGDVRSMSYFVQGIEGTIPK